MKNLFCPVLWLFFTACVCSAFGWSAGGFTVTTVDSPMNVTVAAGAKTLLEITGISFGSANYAAIVSTRQTADSFIINLSAGQSVVFTAVPTGGIRLYGTSAAAGSVKITMKDEGDHFFGITCQNLFGHGPDIRGQTITISNSNILGQANDPPFHRVWSSFYMSSLGYGAFFDSFAEGTYSFGINHLTTVTHTTNTIDWYLFYGPTGDKIHQAYFKIIGAPKKVPIWACGLTIWQDNYSGSAQVLNDVTNYASNLIPLTALWVDRPYSDGGNQWGAMNFSASFANPAGWIKQINSDTGYNVKVMTWAAPLTWGNPVPPAGTYLSGGYDYLDLTNPAAVDWYVRRLDSLQNGVGVQGHKMDRCEENTEVFSSPWHDSTPTNQKQAKYLYLNAKVTDQSLRVKWGDDQFNFPRSAYQRSQQYIGGVWGGDANPPWGGLSGSIAAAIKVGFLGFPVWGSDIGGYNTGAARIPAAQLLRWLAFGCFSGFMENMVDGKEPWLYTTRSDSLVAKYRGVCELRMRLVPYIYSLVNTSADNGVLMRPLPYMYPDDANTYALVDEYLFGPAFLVAPICQDGMTRSVYLPAGTWINFFNYAETHTGGASFTTGSIPLQQIPVYIKTNSVYVTGQVYAGNAKRWNADFNNTRNVVINAFPGNAGDKCGFTYVDYLDGSKQKPISCAAAAGNAVTVIAPAMTVPCTVSVYLGAAPSAVYLNGVKIASPAYNAAAHTLSAPFAAGQTISLSINGAPTQVRNQRPAPCMLNKVRLVALSGGLEVVVPQIQGIDPSDRIDIRIVDLRGITVWRSILPAARAALPARLPMRRPAMGPYGCIVKVNGVAIQRAMITVL
ncbi:MAG: glycoside hydrolase family 31 protein [Chitinivibrionales bacterium]|nr:glycoside hydrolase family 31 protein [Chitinivibrionales bacterium]